MNHLDQHSIAFSVHDLFFPVRNDLPPRNISDEATIEPCSEKTQKEIEDIVRWLAKSKQAALLDETLYKNLPTRHRRLLPRGLRPDRRRGSGSRLAGG